MSVEYPTKSKGFCEFYENIVLLYGKPKFGKTTFGANFPNALFFLTEDGAKHLSISAWRIKSWLEFTYYVKQLESDIKNCPFQNVIIDTVDNLLDMCDKFICDKYKVKTVGDVAYGKGYQERTKEFKTQINSIINLGLGLVFISHAETKSIDMEYSTNPYAMAIADNDGMVEMTIPTIDDKRARKFVLGLCDIIMYVSMNDKGERVLYTKPSRYFEAGDRSGRLPEVLPLDYNAVIDAYYGESDNSDILEKISKGEEYLTKNKIEFEKRKLDKQNKAELEGYLQYLRIRGKAGKKVTDENEEK